MAVRHETSLVARPSGTRTPELAHEVAMARFDALPGIEENAPRRNAIVAVLYLLCLSAIAWILAYLWGVIGPIVVTAAFEGCSSR